MIFVIGVCLQVTIFSRAIGRWPVKAVECDIRLRLFFTGQNFSIARWRRECVREAMSDIRYDVFLTHSPPFRVCEVGSALRVYVSRSKTRQNKSGSHDVRTSQERQTYEATLRCNRASA